MAQKLNSDLTVAFTKERKLLQDLWKVVGAEALRWMMPSVEAQGRVVAEGGPAPLFSPGVDVDGAADILTCCCAARKLNDRENA